jgi:EPS-associated MarR family transcriptional regulator
MRIFEHTPHVSQRRIAKELSISLGTVNYFRALDEKGLVKLDNFIESERKIRYMYILMPKGLSEKANITSRFLKRKIKEHTQLQKIEQLTA